MATKTKAKATPKPADVIDDSMNAAEKFFDTLIKENITGTPSETAIDYGTTAGGADFRRELDQIRHCRYSGMTSMGKSYAAIHEFKQIVQDPNVKLAIYSSDLDDYEDAGLAGKASMVNTLDGLRDVIYSCAREVEKRAKSKQARDEYQPIVLAIDEYEDMVTKLRELGDKETENAINLIAARGVKRKIYLRTISQTVHKRVYKGAIGNNIYTDIAFRAQDKYTSDMVLGSREAMSLRPYEYIIKSGADKFKMLPLWDRTIKK